MPAHQLAAVMPEREFVMYQQYAIKRMLPTRRMELHLAQICSVLAQVNGNKDIGIADFLFDQQEEELEGDDLLEFFEFKPRNVG